MMEAASGMEYERATMLRDRMQQLEWLQNNLKRLKKTREELSFIYPVEIANHPGQQVWYLLHEGQLRHTIAAPSTPKSEPQLLATLHSIYHAPPRVGIPLESIDHVWLIAAWFRKFPKERERCISVDTVLPAKKSKAR